MMLKLKMDKYILSIKENKNQNERIICRGSNLNGIKTIANKLPKQFEYKIYELTLIESGTIEKIN